MKIHLIAALTDEGVIGNSQGLPWHIKEDLQLFKRVTTGKTILMGRKTFDTIGRPLPKRVNIVLDREKTSIPDVKVCGSLEEALLWAEKQSDELYVIGGANVYQQMIPMTDVMHLSHIKKRYLGDVFFPTYNELEWEEIDREEYDEFTAITYRRKT